MAIDAAPVAPAASSAEPGPAAAAPAVHLRAAAVWGRIRSGEDPLAFGAVVTVLALAAGLLWFWAGAHHGGVPAAAAASGHSVRARGDTQGDPPGRTGERTDRGRPAAAAGDTGSGSAPPAGNSETPGTASARRGPDAPPEPGQAVVAVHVAGAVLRPGLYHLPGGSRVADAIAAAGGRVARADLDRLNLAAPLVDGQKVFVVRRGEAVPADVGGAGPLGMGWAGGLGAPGGPDGQATAPAQPVDLNTADLAALDSLPGIGPATARAILEERARRGGFRSTRDLLRIPGIGDTRFARLKDRVRV